MRYYFSKTLTSSFDETVTKATAELKKEGFGVITEIEVKEALKEKLDVDFKRYRILGACNPAFAHEALQVEDKIGTMLPCNVIVQEISAGVVEVAAIAPIASMQAIDKAKLKSVAEHVQAQLKRVIAALRNEKKGKSQRE